MTARTTTYMPGGYEGEIASADGGTCGPILSWIFYSPASFQVSYRTLHGEPIDFWMMNGEPPPGCVWTASMPSIVSKMSSSSYEFRTDVLPGGSYNFVFLNRNKQPVTLHVDITAVYQTDIHTETRTHITDSTTEIVFTSQAESITSHPAGLGPSFFGGFAVLVTGIALITAVVTVRMLIARTRVPVESCSQCGARIDHRSKFCDNCGTRLPEP